MLGERTDEQRAADSARRDEAADQRERIADERDRIADERDRIADERDRLAEDRDHAVDLREDQAAERVRVAEHELSGLEIAMDTRGVIEQAKGMIMITLRIDADAAFDVLVRRSQANHTKLVDVAREVVEAGMAGRIDT